MKSKIDILLALSLIILILIGGKIYGSILSDNYKEPIGETVQIQISHKKLPAEENRPLGNIPDICIEFTADYSEAAIIAPAEPIGTFTVTAYTLREEECGKAPDDPWYGITASGTKVKERRTIAADWDVLPAGSVVYIEGIGLRTVEDRGGAIKGNDIDLYMEDLQEALSWGVRQRDVWLIKEGD
jgi:3D (Asp-Asp-Asp) domain-containing protein